MTLASLGSICVFEHMFDKKLSHTQAIPYAGIINTEYQLIRDTALNGGKPTISNVIDCLSNKKLFIDNLRITSNKEWLCHDLMHFVIHNGYCRKYFTDTNDVKQYFQKIYDTYKCIDIFMYYSMEFKIADFQRLLTTCKLHNKHAKLLCFSNISDFYEADIVNINVDNIIFNTDMNDEKYIKFENSWNITKNTIEKLKKLKFDSQLFKNKS